MEDLTQQIDAEIVKAIEVLGGVSTGGFSPDRYYEILSLSGAPSDLLGTIGAWKDTLPDQDVLDLLKEWNAKNGEPDFVN